jgi:hypothetical protein
MAPRSCFGTVETFEGFMLADRMERVDRRTGGSARVR